MGLTVRDSVSVMVRLRVRVKGARGCPLRIRGGELGFRVSVMNKA